MRFPIASRVWMIAVLACLSREAAPAQVASGKTSQRLPASVQERTRRLIQDYLGSTPLRRIPLLDPAIDWDLFSNWPDQFLYRGRSYRLEIADYSGHDPKRLRHRSQVRPGMYIGTDYSLLGGNSAVDNNIYPRGSWDEAGRLSLASLHWARKGLEEKWTMVFMHRHRPSGELHSFTWTPRGSEEEQEEVYGRDGKVVGVAKGKSYRWNGRPVEWTEFSRLSDELYKGGNPTGQKPGQTTPPRAVPPRR